MLNTPKRKESHNQLDYRQLDNEVKYLNHRILNKLGYLMTRKRIYI